MTQFVRPPDVTAFTTSVPPEGSGTQENCEICGLLCIPAVTAEQLTVLPLSLFGRDTIRVCSRCVDVVTDVLKGMQHVFNVGRGQDYQAFKVAAQRLAQRPVELKSATTCPICGYAAGHAIWCSYGSAVTTAG